MSNTDNWTTESHKLQKGKHTQKKPTKHRPQISQKHKEENNITLKISILNIKYAQQLPK